MNEKLKGFLVTALFIGVLLSLVGCSNYGIESPAPRVFDTPDSYGPRGPGPINGGAGRFSQRETPPAPRTMN